MNKLSIAVLSILVILSFDFACQKQGGQDSYKDVLQKFQNPPSEYGSAPLWVWNDEVTTTQIEEQLAEIKTKKPGVEEQLAKAKDQKARAARRVTELRRLKDELMPRAHELLRRIKAAEQGTDADKAKDAQQIKDLEAHAQQLRDKYGETIRQHTESKKLLSKLADAE